MRVLALYGIDSKCRTKCEPNNPSGIKTMLAGAGINVATVSLDIDTMATDFETGKAEYVGPPRDIYTVKRLPSKAKMAANLAGAVVGVAATFIKTGKILCCADHRMERWDKCLACDHIDLIKGKYRCLSFPYKKGGCGCGCHMKTKTKLLSATCLQSNWDEIDAKYELPTT